MKIEVASVPDFITFDSDEEAFKPYCHVMDKADDEVSLRFGINEVQTEKKMLLTFCLEYLLIIPVNITQLFIADNANAMNFLQAGLSLLTVGPSGNSSDNEVTHNVK
ncbi:hypothetical protein TTRE_0000837401 [Trichuris trichiura]|uniref:Uncharacterized protein n=1 Tax=Trichuris trichiura TaxID=36087 RepID=A0A077ZI29_TRITR|nr:hypothetical protein TTRE_0000837401 [Trichuris trichiura]